MLSENQLKPAIYYIVKGRLSDSNTKIPFEEKFIHENPILAREQAFSFYKNYASILEEHQQLFYKPLQCPFILANENFGGIDIQKYSVADVRYQNPKMFDKGIGIYMVVENPIDYMDKADIKNERFLIHGIWNFDNLDMQKLKDGLIREYGYYMSSRYEMNNCDEIVDFSVLENKKSLFVKPKLYTIISTPFNWNFNYFLNQNKMQLQKSKRLKTIQDKIKNGNLIRNAFLSSLNQEEIVQSVASLLNENGGFLFIGIDKYRKSINLFEEKKVNEVKNEIFMTLRKEFQEISNAIKISVYKVGLNTVLVYEIKKSKDKPVFIRDNHLKIFYRRNEFGSYKFNDPEEIVTYCIERNTKIIRLSDLLDQL